MRRNLKRLFVTIYICLVCLLAIATFLEQAYGTDFIEKYIYHAFGFVVSGGFWPLRLLWHQLESGCGSFSLRCCCMAPSS